LQTESDSTLVHLIEPQKYRGRTAKSNDSLCLAGVPALWCGSAILFLAANYDGARCFSALVDFAIVRGYDRLAGQIAAHAAVPDAANPGKREASAATKH
jgi:hypothetical protein